ncbi:MAG: deoxyhypusine synthase [Methanothrix sp.]|uniref:deoxyhypusine synthase n=1 Tax=Methanothrix sp. TaxID=90426 RepID=UPI0025D2214B|nr:deoxyhypusine synthase [Methanothrix sp.]MCQ8903681.1 deoxyhypusine synthase [Methanothrix sp.]
MSYPESEMQHRTTIPVVDRSIGDLVSDMARMGFQAGQLGQSLRVWENMLSKDVTIFLGLAGAMVPAGLQEMIAYLISRRYVDCLVSTGANLFHDLCEGLGIRHYRGSACADDAHLNECRIDRIFDVFVSEVELHRADKYISDLVTSLRTDVAYSSREMMELLGRELPETTILGAAYRAGVPIFVPALSDSSIGIGMVIAWRNGHRVTVDQIRDVDEITQISEKSAETGVVFIGGGVPKNFIQQTKVISELMGTYRGGHSYAIQYTTDTPHFGGLSGCTFSEAVSWGKVDKEARMAQVFSDATITVPLVVHALRERVARRYSVPRFTWRGSELELVYERS